jgi:DNA-binding response OmpR family regulator
LCGDSGPFCAECGHAVLADARALSQPEREAMAQAGLRGSRLLLLGVEQPLERAALLTLGCAEALPAAVGIRELEARARRVSQLSGMVPRRRTVGPLTLDLFHRDVLVGTRWAGLFPREFELLWRLSERCGARLTRRQLLKDVWRLEHDPETNRVEVHVSRLRAKLAFAGAGDMIGTDPAGGYFIRPSAFEPQRAYA